MRSRSDVVCGHGGNPGQIMFRPRSTLYSLFPKCGFFLRCCCRRRAHIDYKQGTDGEMGKEGRMTRGEGDTCTNAEMIAILELQLDPCEKQFYFASSCLRFWNNHWEKSQSFIRELPISLLMNFKPMITSTLVIKNAGATTIFHPAWVKLFPAAI